MAMQNITRHVLDGVAVCALVVSGSVVVSHLASADPTDFGGLNWLRQPRADSLRVQGSDALVTFTDYSDEETDYNIRVYQRGEPANPVVATVGAVPDTNRSATRTVGPVPQGVALCAQVQANRLVLDAPLGPIAPQADVRSSGWSNEVCSDPATAPADLGVSIRGNESPRASSPAAYVVEIRNDGALAAKGVTLDVATSGNAKLGDQAMVAAGWQSNGFTCTPRPPSGGETAALSCTGGTANQGVVSGAVMVAFTGPGLGAVHAQVSAEGDPNPGNNGTALNVQPA